MLKNCRSRYVISIFLLILYHWSVVFVDTYIICLNMDVTPPHFYFRVLSFFSFFFMIDVSNYKYKSVERCL